jgi:hypothetical protein
MQNSKTTMTAGWTWRSTFFSKKALKIIGIVD